MLDNIVYFTDLDDTITSNKVLFYSKIKLFKKTKNFDKNKEKYFNLIFKDFEINKNFLSLVKKNNINEVFILSRNDDEFIQFFVKEFNKQYSNTYNFKIIGGFGNISTEKKLSYINDNSFLISDIFEYKKLIKNANFISVDNYSILKIYFIYVIKIFYFNLFIIKNLGVLIKAYIK